VVDLRGDYVPFLVAIELSNSLEAEIVALGGSTREYYFFWLSANQVGDVLSGFFDSSLSLPSKFV